MKGITAYEKLVLAATALFVVVCAALSALGTGEREYTVTVTDRSPEHVVLSESVQADGIPDSLIPGERICVNMAPVRDLARLPGIGESRAAAIEAHRAENGTFRTGEDLLAVDGIGAVTLEKILPCIEFG